MLSATGKVMASLVTTPTTSPQRWALVEMVIVPVATSGSSTP